jgi:hypothetical protein
MDDLDVAEAIAPAHPGLQRLTSKTVFILTYAKFVKADRNSPCAGKLQTSRFYQASDGPQPSGCINVRTTLGSKSLSVFEDKWRPGKAHALEIIDARPD